MNQTMKKVPSHEMVYRTVRSMIMFGELLPGQAITIQGLVERLGVGMTPVREAIRRLTAEGALEFQGNRRVCVPVMDSTRLKEITYVREHVEMELCRMAMANLGERDHAILTAIDKEVDKAIAVGDVAAYLERNQAFHFYIYERADAPVLFPLAQSMWLQIGPFLRVVCGRFGTAQVEDQHHIALRAIKNRDPEALAVAIRDDIRQGVEMIIDATEKHEFDQIRLTE